MPPGNPESRDDEAVSFLDGNRSRIDLSPAIHDVTYSPFVITPFERSKIALG